MVYVVDAHVIVWYLDDAGQLGPVGETVMSDHRSRLVVPTIVLAEISHLHGRGRIRVSPARVRTLLRERPNAATYPLDERVLDLLPTGLEIHDGIIVATALAVGADRTDPVRVITRDRQIAASGLVDVLW